MNNANNVILLVWHAMQGRKNIWFLIKNNKEIKYKIFFTSNFLNILIHFLFYRESGNCTSCDSNLFRKLDVNQCICDEQYFGSNSCSECYYSCQTCTE